jgi:hypothetical protein
MSYDQWKTASPYDDCPPDDYCYWCEKQLPADIEENTPQFSGYCSIVCELMYESKLKVYQMNRSGPLCP